MATRTVSLHQWLETKVALTDKDACLLRDITHDSRDVRSGTAFLAYPGLRSDGRAYIEEALEKGASAIIYEAEGDPVCPKTTVPMIPFPRLSEAVADLAASFYNDPSESLEVIGVTGTNGKTSCTQFIAQAFALHEVSCGVLGTLGNGLLPDLQKTTHTTLDAIHLQRSLARLKNRGAEAVALEVSSHALAQGRVKGVHFDIAVLTQLSRDHLDYHSDMDAYARAKSLLFQQPGLQYAVLNADDALGQALAKTHANDLAVFLYSMSHNAVLSAPSVVAKKITPLNQGFHVEVKTPWGEGEFQTNLLGRFNISNLLAVLTVLGLSGIALGSALEHLSKLEEVPGRMQCFGGTEAPLVVVDYAHTPDALQKALEALREHCQGKLYCVFGCGGNRDSGKRPEMGAVAEAYADRVIITSDNPREEDPEAIARDILKGLKAPERAEVALDRALAIQHAVNRAQPNDVVLIAGKGHEAVQLIGRESRPFSDAEQVMKVLKKGLSPACG